MMWHRRSLDALPSNSYAETGRDNFPSDGTSRLSNGLNEPIAPGEPRRFYQARWLLAS